MYKRQLYVVICFQISIFEPLETTGHHQTPHHIALWFAFKLVSLNHWKQPSPHKLCLNRVVICFQISIFEPLETTIAASGLSARTLWFAFKLVSLNHWKQLLFVLSSSWLVVICFQISIFEPLETTKFVDTCFRTKLWFAFKLVSLNHWKQPRKRKEPVSYTHLDVYKRQRLLHLCFADRTCMMF